MESLLLRFTNDTFDHDTAATIGESNRQCIPGGVYLSWSTGVDFKVKTIVLGGKRVKLSIWVSLKKARLLWWFMDCMIIGHSWSGEISYFDSKLLPRCTGGYSWCVS